MECGIYNGERLEKNFGSLSWMEDFCWGASILGEFVLWSLDGHLRLLIRIEGRVKFVNFDIE